MTTRPMGPRDVARATGVSTDTLRHYERQGLLPAVRRTPAGYRQYSAAAVERVLLIQRALVIGFSLAELKRILSVRDRGGAPCRSVRELLGQRLDEQNRRIEELAAHREERNALVREWDVNLAKTADGRPAHLLEALGAQASMERSRSRRHAASRVRRSPLL